MTQTVTALFDDYGDGRRAVETLEENGISFADISIMANDAHGEHGKSAIARSKAGEDAGKGAGVGAAVGGLGGVLAGLGLLAIPGLGPVVAAGWLASTVVGAAGGAAIGAATGGLVGALTKAGVPEEDAHVYAEGVRRGGALVTVRVADELVPSVRSLLDSQRHVDIVSRRAAYQAQGWSRFDDAAPAYTPDQVATERTRLL